MLNRPTGTGLAGAWRTDIQWRSLARLAGLPFVESRSSEVAFDPGPDDDRRVLVVEGQLIEDPAQPWECADDLVRVGLRQLQRRSGIDVLEARFTGQDARTLRSVAAIPAMQQFGAGALDALATALDRRAANRLVGGSRS